MKYRCCIYRLYAVLLLMGMLSCIPNDDFEVPQLSQQSPISLAADKEVRLSALKNSFDPLTRNTISFHDSGTYLIGFVVSSDQAGNFYKELVIQDKPENPTAGIMLKIDQRSLSDRYTIGQKVIIMLDGLSMGLDNGILKLGKLVEESIETIAASQMEQFVIRTPEILEVVPRKVTIADFDPATESLFVQVDDVQFDATLLSSKLQTLAGETSDEFQGERDLIECTTQERIVLSTSTFADFKTLQLSTKSGSASGILSKNFTGDYYVLRLNTATDLNLSEEKRCDVAYLQCKTTQHLLETPLVLFEEDFNTIKKTVQLDEIGWINTNSNSDPKRWENKKVPNIDNRHMTISAFNSRYNPLECWLITPPIDLDQTTNEVLTFDIQSKFNNAKALTIWATTNYSEAPGSTDWQQLDIILPSKHSNTVRIPPYPLHCLSGEVRIGFRYLGRDPGATSTYILDNILISGTPK